MDIAVIKETILALKKEDEGSNQKIKDHVEDGNFWRGVVISNFLVIVIAIISFAVAWGSVKSTVERNCKRLDVIEETLFLKSHPNNVDITK